MVEDTILSYWAFSLAETLSHFSRATELDTNLYSVLTVLGIHRDQLGLTCHRQ
jgi:hypothetical protein